MTKETTIKRNFQDFNPESLDVWERTKYNALISAGLTKQESIQVLINHADGDYKYLSDELCDLAIMMETNTVKS